MKQAMALLVLCIACTPVAGAQAPKELPEAPKPKLELPRRARVADKKFFTVIGTLAASESFDMFTTSQSLHRGADEQQDAWLLGKRPSDARLALTQVGWFAGQTYLAYRLKKSHKKWLHRIWWIPAFVEIGGRTYYGVHNLGVCQPKAVYVGNTGQILWATCH